MDDDFRVTALVAAYNEADIIAQVVEHLIAQRINVYFIDDGSTDDTVAIVERYAGRGVTGIERRPREDTSTRFSWTDILHRKEALAAELDSAWFMHHDADEFRESPARDLDLRASIQAVDQLGYNAIAFALLNFPPTDNGFRAGDSLREHFEFYEPAAPFDEVQVKCWKKGTSPVDLASSGGHQARFSGRRICPIRFVTLHYPIRSQAHGERKVFQERRPRFAEAERAAGWHVQYDPVATGHSFLRDPATLLPFSLDRVRDNLSGVPTYEDVRALESKLHTERQRLEAAHEERRRSEAALQEALAERDRANIRATAAQQQAAAHASDAALAREDLESLYRSRSWQVTQPLRLIYSAISGSPPAGDVKVAGTTRAAPVRWGDLARVSPISQSWGFDRGLPIDRHYIRLFLEQHRGDIRGRVLEIKDPYYATLLGQNQIATIDVLDINPRNGSATIVADLAHAETVASNQFDCFILTQTLHIIFDVQAAVREAARLLTPGGVLLCTIPAVSRVSDEGGGLESGDYWRMTRAAVVRLFAGAFDRDEVHVATYGNVRTCAAFLYGIAAEELDDRDLTIHDPWFPLIHGVRAVKRRA